MKPLSLRKPVVPKTPRQAALSGSPTLEALSRGEGQSATLAECVAVDQACLLLTTFPDISKTAMALGSKACALGILGRMRGVGAVLLDEIGPDGIDRCRDHPSDTVRGWGCFMIGAQQNLSIDRRLAAIKALADDAHFGVREWAWMAVRPHVASDLPGGIERLANWTRLPSARLRRFACEVLRPRGVWCTHIPELKKHPAQALPILEPLRADPVWYVQDSVANWLNDAGKDCPAWVRDVCADWLRNDPPSATRRICQRALRNLR